MKLFIFLMSETETQNGMVAEVNKERLCIHLKQDSRDILSGEHQGEVPKYILQYSPVTRQQIK